MNEICRKYNLSEEDYKRMLNDGILTTTVARYNEIYECFKKNKSITGSTEDAVIYTSEEKNTCRSNVYKIVAMFK